MTEKPTCEELEPKLEESKQEIEKYRSLIGNLNEVLYTLDLNARITFISPNIESIGGFRPEEVIGRVFSDFVHEEDQEGRIEKFLKILSGEEVRTEYRYLTKNGKKVWVMTKAKPISKNGKVVGVQGILVDITDRKKMEDSLRKSEERYRNILETIEEGYYELDHHGNFIFFNDSFCKALGYHKKELLGMNACEIADDENAQKMSDAVNWIHRTGKSYKALDWQLIRKDGSTCHIEASVSLSRNSEKQTPKIFGITRDITDRKRIEEEKEQLYAKLRKSQQMEAIGTLAGGVAHDFNNILSTVIGYAEISLSEIPEDTAIYRNFDRILSAGNRAKDLVKQILTIAREEKEDLSPVPVISLIKETMKLIRSTLPTTIEIKENINCNELLIVYANSTHLHQIILNLVTNAKHAMGNNNGVLKICVEKVFFDNDEVEHSTILKPGHYVQIAISDTGTGIPPENLDKIFNPYFTTKERGEGTGLGLSIIHGIVTKYQGHIDVDSEIGKGTEFNIYLPLVKESKSKSKLECEDAIKLPRGNESILLVDDEQFIVELEKQYLEKLGYNVTSRTSSIEALEAYKFKPDKFDLVITDMNMPNMNGDRLAREIKHIRNIPVLMCTGFSDYINDCNEDIDAFMMKPVARSEMANTVRSLLDETK